MLGCFFFKKFFQVFHTGGQGSPYLSAPEYLIATEKRPESFLRTTCAAPRPKNSLGSAPDSSPPQRYLFAHGLVMVATSNR